MEDGFVLEVAEHEQFGGPEHQQAAVGDQGRETLREGALVVQRDPGRRIGCLDHGHRPERRLRQQRQDDHGRRADQAASCRFEPCSEDEPERDQADAGEEREAVQQQHRVPRTLEVDQAETDDAIVIDGHHDEGAPLLSKALDASVGAGVCGRVPPRWNSRGCGPARGESCPSRAMISSAPQMPLHRSLQLRRGSADS
jgi:hypothetical protein